MSDIVKWGLLTVGIVSVIGLILMLPISDSLGLATTSMSEAIRWIVTYSSDALYNGRALINTFLMGYGIKLLSALIMWIFFKWIFLIGVKIAVLAYRWIFK